MTPWVTSATDSLAAKTTITVSNARFSATLDPQSVTTFVGTP
jgi:O-glycosyl hydrolase